MTIHFGFTVIPSIAGKQWSSPCSGSDNVCTTNLGVELRQKGFLKMTVNFGPFLRRLANNGLPHALVATTFVLQILELSYGKKDFKK